MARKPSVHYVNNKQLYAALVEYNTKKEKMLSEGIPLDKIPIPEYIGECILMISKKLSSKSNFMNYSYRDEMIADGIENCLAAVDNFDVKKWDNPFAYFTRIIWFAFLRRIQKEKKQHYLKLKNYQKNVAEDSLITEFLGYNPYYKGNFNSNEIMDDYIETFEKNVEKKKKAKLSEPKGIDKIMKDYENEK